MKNRMPAVVAATGVLVLTALTGCSTSAAPILQDVPEKNPAQWVMPMDQYVPADTVASDYAENLLVQPCMEAAGYAWSVPYRDITADSGPSWNAVQRKLFNVDLAKEVGYHAARSSDSSLAAWVDFSQQEVSPAMDVVLTDCIYAAREELPRLQSDADIAVSLGNAAYDAAMQEGSVKDAASKWAACMQPAGVSDLPASPSEMPSSSLRAQFDLDDPKSMASPEEIALATRDADCQESSGWLDSAYDEEWDKQLSMLEDNADTLERVKATIEANRVSVYEVISSNAPTS